MMGKEKPPVFGPEAIYCNAGGSQGAGISNWSQILRAVRLSISVCRGALARLPVLVFW